MKNKILLSFLLLSFSSFSSADLDYEVRGVQRVSEMFGDAVCVSLYIENNTRNSLFKGLDEMLCTHNSSGY